MTTVKEMLKKEGHFKTYLKARQAAREYTYKLRERGLVSFAEPDAAEKLQKLPVTICDSSITTKKIL